MIAAALILDMMIVFCLMNETVITEFINVALNYITSLCYSINFENVFTPCGQIWRYWTARGFIT